MRIADGFVLKNIADTFVVIPTGEKSVDFKSVISLNEVGAFIWKQLENDISKEDLLKAITSEYRVDPNIAETDMNEFINNLQEANLLA